MTPPGLTAEKLPAVFRDRLARLDRDWPSVAEYARFFVAHTAPLLDPADPLLLDNLAYPAAAAEAFRAALDGLVTVRPVAGVDHAAPIMSPAGAAACAEELAAALGAATMSRYYCSGDSNGTSSAGDEGRA